MNEGMNLASINQREVLVVYVESKNRPIKESLESEVKLHQQDFFTSEWCQEVHEPADKSCWLCFCHFDNNENTPACKHTSARMSVRSGDDHLAVSEGRGCDELLRFRRVSKVEPRNCQRSCYYHRAPPKPSSPFYPVWSLCSVPQTQAADDPLLHASPQLLTQVTVICGNSEQSWKLFSSQQQHEPNSS